MKLIFVSALFTAALSILGAPAPAASTASGRAAPIAAQPDDAGLVLSECVDAGGVCRKSACRSGETPVPLSCGHDLGCCLAR